MLRCTHWLKFCVGGPAAKSRPSDYVLVDTHTRTLKHARMFHMQMRSADATGCKPWNVRTPSYNNQMDSLRAHHRIPATNQTRFRDDIWCNKKVNHIFRLDRNKCAILRLEKMKIDTLHCWIHTYLKR